MLKRILIRRVANNFRHGLAIQVRFGAHSTRHVQFGARKRNDPQSNFLPLYQKFKHSTTSSSNSNSNNKMSFNCQLYDTNSMTKNKKKSNNVNRYHSHSRSFCSSNGNANTQSGSITEDKMLLRSIEQDASKDTQEITFKQMYDYTKVQSHKLQNEETKKKVYTNNRLVLIESAEFVRKQLATRLAKVIMRLRSLPYGVLESPSFHDVHAMYCNTYRICKTMPQIQSLDDETRAVNIYRFWLKSHLMTIPKICFGLLEKTIESKGAFSIEDTPYLGDFLDEICMQRLGIRMLLGHQLALHDSAYKNKLIIKDEPNFLDAIAVKHHNDKHNNNNNSNDVGSSIDPSYTNNISNLSSSSSNDDDDDDSNNGSDDNSGNNNAQFHGLFEENCDFSIYVHKSIRDATDVCQLNFNGISPNVNIIDKRQMFECTYVPEMFHHMIFELLKNSMRATIEHCLKKYDNTIDELDNNIDIKTKISNEISQKKYDVNVILVDAINGDVTIKVEDRGGGMSKSELEKVFLYGYTTAYRGELASSPILADNIGTMNNNDDDNNDTDKYSKRNKRNDSDSDDNNGTNERYELNRNPRAKINDGYDSEEENMIHVGSSESEEYISQFLLRTDLERQRELYKKILYQSEQELDTDWQNVESITSDNFMKYIEDEKYLHVHRGVLGALKSAPMFGLGYGLPVVRVYSKYFGGSCKLFSIHGYGTDAYLHCPNLSQLKDFKV